MVEEVVSEIESRKEKLWDKAQGPSVRDKQSQPLPQPAQSF